MRGPVRSRGTLRSPRVLQATAHIKQVNATHDTYGCRAACVGLGVRAGAARSTVRPGGDLSSLIAFLVLYRRARDYRWAARARRRTGWLAGWLGKVSQPRAKTQCNARSHEFFFFFFGAGMYTGLAGTWTLTSRLTGIVSGSGLF